MKHCYVKDGKNTLNILFKYVETLLIVSLFVVAGCGGSDGTPSTDRNYRQDMRNFVENISAYAKNVNPNFTVITNNGLSLITKSGEPDSSIDTDYIKALKGVGVESLFYGYKGEDDPTPVSVQNYTMKFLNIAKNNGLKVLVIDYCSSTSKIDDSYKRNAANGYISFAADSESLDDIPTYPGAPYHANSNDIKSLKDAKNFLYLINPSNYSTKEDFLNAIRNTNYDVVVIDLFYNGNPLTLQDVTSLKVKANGGKRLVIAYMSIGEASKYRYYWKEDWETNPPSWLAEENHNWPGSYKVRYWENGWQDIIYGSSNAYLDKILKAGFDGVYLDGVDTFEYFENRKGS